MKGLYKLFDMICSLLTIVIIEGLSVAFLGFCIVGDFSLYIKMLLIAVIVFSQFISIDYVCNWVVNYKNKTRRK